MKRTKLAKFWYQGLPPNVPPLANLFTTNELLYNKGAR